MTISTIVLVHGSWHGGWCWSRVTPLLRQAGLRVLTPTLTGQGERHHLLTRDTGLATHITDVVATLRSNEVTGAMLVGHSYGGMVIRGVADRVPDRLAGLVYLDAHVPQAGDSMCTLAGPEVAGRLAARVAAEGQGWVMPPSGAGVFGTLGPDADWIDSLATPMAWKAYTDALVLHQPDARIAHHAYLRCTGHRRSYFDAAADRYRDQPGWTVRDLDAAHNVMVTHPALLAATFLELLDRWQRPFPRRTI